jgi:hypothetical protein
MSVQHRKPFTVRPWQGLVAGTALGLALSVPIAAIASGSSSPSSDRVAADAATILAAAQDLQSALATPSASPSASPTFSSNAPSPSPIDTPTPSVTDTPTPTPTVSPSVAPSSTARAGACLPVPSSCGFPDATNTGTLPGPLVTHTGTVEVNTAGTVINGWDMTGGRIDINANDVTVSDSRITTGSPFAIHLASGVTGVRIVDDTIIGLAGCGVGVNGGEYVAQRVNVSGCEDGFQVGGGTQIIDDYVHNLRYTATSHNDGVQAFSGSGLVVRHDTIVDDPQHGNSAVFLQPYGGPITGATIADNLLDGAGYTVKIEQSTGVVISNNDIGRGYRWGWLSAGGSSRFPNHVPPTLAGNFFDDNGLPAS